MFSVNLFYLLITLKFKLNSKRN